MKKRKKIGIIIGIFLFIIAAVFAWYFLSKKPYDEAALKFSAATKYVKEKNLELDEIIAQAQKIIDAKDQPWNPTAVTALEETISDAGQTKRIIGECPKKTRDVISETKRLEANIDYSEEISAIKTKLEYLEDSIKLLRIINEKNIELEKNIKSAKEVVSSGEKPLDEVALTDLVNVIATANEVEKNVMESTDRTTEISVDYSQEIAALQEGKIKLENSIQQLKLVTTPPEEYIIQCLQRVSSVSGSQAVTEDNDPNGNLNKAGGYTSAVYFSDTVVKDAVYGDSIIDKGTSCGGCIEVYDSLEYAEKRNTYLSTYDGATALNPGSHIVVGTVVVRTSEKLTASQQKELEKQVIDELTRLD